MLEPREADIPILFVVLVVLPIVTYILLGKWNETAEKKARISVLAQLASEDSHRVEPTVCPDDIPSLPSPKTVFYECARCSAPATTRCSRCKSVRYCSGKCQIIHWRQGHKLECQQWQDGNMDFPAGGLLVTDSLQLRSLYDNSRTYTENDEEPPCSDDLFDLPNDWSSMTSDPSQDPEAERKLSHSDRRVPGRVKRESLKGAVSMAWGFDETVSNSVEADASLKDGSLQHKFGTGNISPSSEIHRRHDRNMPTYSHPSSNQRNAARHSQKPTNESRNLHKQSNSPGLSTSPLLDRNAINGCDISSEFTFDTVDFQEGVASSVDETSYLSSATENISARGGNMYMKPPYVLRPSASLSQNADDRTKSRKCRSQGMDRNADDRKESRISQMHISTNIPSQSCNVTSTTNAMKMSGSRKSSKATKWNILGLNKDFKRFKILFPYEDLVKLFRCEVWDISPRGLINCGNSCYANAVLQCLSCTKPLMVYLLQRSHTRSCRIRDWCLMCELEQHVSMLREGVCPLSPSKILTNINGCWMGGGNQEDAHEFLRLLVMSMQSICLEGVGGEKEVDPGLQETTLIHQIFGGRLKSKVKCMKCHLESERYENIMDLTLEIHGRVESLEDALRQFTAPEDLDGENKYRCGRCSKYVKARKQLSLHEVPNILTVVLKRFQTGEYGKINKCVSFPEMLDMIPFVTRTADMPPLYLLYAVVVHLDTLNASFSGHYVSYVKDLQGTWFRIDDSEVQVVPLSQVMSEGAYMLFYSRAFPRPPRVYIEKAPEQVPSSVTHTIPHTEKSSRYEEDKPSSGAIFPPNGSGNIDASIKPDHRNDTSEWTHRSDQFRDFSDTTSSEWSLFTSSDDSSFTTENTRDSFSTVDYGETGTLDTISSIFAPYYVPEYPQSNTVSCTKFSPSRAETRFHMESKVCALDSSMLAQPVGNVHTGKHPECASAEQFSFRN